MGTLYRYISFTALNCCYLPISMKNGIVLLPCIFELTVLDETCGLSYCKQHCSFPGEGSGSVVECLSPNRAVEGAQWLSGRVLDSRPKGGGFEPHRRHCVVSLTKNINPSLVLVQPRKTCPFITERLLMGRKESNQTKKDRAVVGSILIGVTTFI